MSKCASLKDTSSGALGCVLGSLSSNMGTGLSLVMFRFRLLACLGVAAFDSGRLLLGDAMTTSSSSKPSPSGRFFCPFLGVPAGLTVAAAVGFGRDGTVRRGLRS